MSADIGQLVQLGVGDIRRKGVVDGRRRAGFGEVLDDHVGVSQPPAAFAVVTLRVGGHLALALRAEGDQPAGDVGAELPGRCGIRSGPGGEDARTERKRQDDRRCGPAPQGPPPIARWLKGSPVEAWY